MHPVLLDAALQVLGAALPDGAGTPASHDTYLPMGIDRVTFHNPAPGGRLISHVGVRPFADARPETITGDVRVADERGVPVVEIAGLHLKRVHPDALLGGTDVVDSWLYQVEWEPKTQDRSIPRRPALAPNGWLAHLQPELASMRNAWELERYDSLLPQLVAAAGAWVARAMKDLGWDLAPGERVVADALANRLGVALRHWKLLRRLLGMLAEDGFLEASEDGWIVKRAPGADDPSATVRALIETYPEYDAEITLLERSGPALADALRGATDPLDLLFPGGDRSTAERLYEQSPLARAYNGLVRAAVTSAIEALGPRHTARILEIGGGTGGTTSGLLPALDPGRTEYVFTDISRAFTTSARQKYRDYPFVRYRTLDIEQDPRTQGFDGERFDVIVAANVLHATRSLRETFRHVESLLAPRGVLVLLEMTRPQRDIEVVFGLTDGWWRFTDHDLRPASLLMSAPRWLALLRDLGFREPVAVPGESDGVHGCAASQTVIVAGAPAAAHGFNTAAGAWLVLEDAGGCGRALAQALAAHGGRAVRVERGTTFARLDDDRVVINPDEPADYVRMLDLEPAWRGVVHLWSLDATPDDRATAASLATEQALGTGSVLSLVQAMASTGAPGRLVIATRGAQYRSPDHGLRLSQATVWGLAKVIALEHPELRCLRIDLDPSGAGDEVAQLAAEVVADDREDQVMFRGRERFVARLTRLPVPVRSAAAGSPVRFEVGRRGVLDSISARQAARRTPGRGEVEIRVQATGLNFRDVMGAMGIYPGDPGPLGSECAGVVSAVGTDVAGLQVGDEVLAIVPGCLGTYVTGPADFVIRRPARLTVEQAASVAIPYLTAHFTLHHVAGLRSGEHVLIHSAAGGVGLAALHLARRAGAHVYATAGCEERRAYLTSLGIRHVYDSRSTAFAAAIVADTGGRGVDVVLNSLGPEFVGAGLSVLARNGRFVEIAKTGLLSAESRTALRSDISYVPVDWSEAAREAPGLIRSMLEELIAHLTSGEIDALPVQTFPATEAAAAFRFMAQARHIGKVVIVHRNDEGGAAMRVRPDGAYLVTGGLRGLGLLVAEHLVARGARHLVLMGRRKPDTSALETIARFERQGVRVMVARADVSIHDELARELTRVTESLPPLAGIVHAAGVLNDGVLQRLDRARVAEVLAPKVEGAWNLYDLTRATSLDFFVLFSSIAGVLGSPGQANHAAANAFLDTFAHHLRSAGVPAVSIDWGAWSDIGAAAERHVGERIAAKGVETIAPALGLAALEAAISRRTAQIAVTPMCWTTFLESFASGSEPPFLARMAEEIRHAPAVSSTLVTTGLVSQLESAPAAKRRTLLVGYVREHVSRVLGLGAPEAIDRKQPLTEMGLDSLMAVELRNLLASGLCLTRGLPATVVFDYPSVEALAAYLETQLPLEATRAAATDDNRVFTQAEAATPTLDSIEELSDAEVDRLFAERVEHR
jgi:NADPH:quinone reductase-like Zn-dependent oxidoreductase/SAM-dependent methyltransferase/NADP-dependent 3-hydroxy acid dehydrogenase YdfG